MVCSLYTQAYGEVSENPISLPLNPCESILRPGFSPRSYQAEPWLRKEPSVDWDSISDTLHVHLTHLTFSDVSICCEAILGSGQLTPLPHPVAFPQLISSQVREELLLKAISSCAPASSALPRPHSTVSSLWSSELIFPLPFQPILLILSVLFWK